MKLFSRQKNEPAAESALTEEAVGAAVMAALEEEKRETMASRPAESPQAGPLPVEPARPALKPGKVALTHRAGVKVLAFFLVIAMAALACGSVLAAVVMAEEEIYTTSEWQYRHNAFSNLAMSDARVLRDLLQDAANGNQEAIRYLEYRNIAEVEAKFSSGPYRSWGYDNGSASPSSSYQFTHEWYIVTIDDAVYYYQDYTPEDRARNNPDSVTTAVITIYLSDHFTEKDDYYFADLLISSAYALRYWVYAIGIAALTIAIVCFVFLMCASGRRKGYPEPQPGWGTKVPFDLLTLAVLAVIVLLTEFIAGASYFLSAWEEFAVFVAAAVSLAVMALGWCMSAALRWKLGGWWKNTVVFHALRLCWYLVKKLWTGLRIAGRGLWRGLRAVGRGIAALFRGVPLVWKTVLVFAGLVALDVLVFLMFLLVWWDYEGLIIYWALKNLLLFPVAVIIALMLRRLQQGGAALAAGDLSYQVDTSRMPWDFKRHGENLNRIAEGMTAAVEQRMKSERMKTELITNVSHDIKTPLTSIINYADLIGKEPCENGKITEYAAVLHRQSDRLKRLIDDLVEASKASTGNLEVLLAPCEVGVLLTQTAGEYEQRLKERNLELVTKQPEQPVKILADGRRLWRVFDNLMNNVCKYAQSGTRVYLTLEEAGGQAVISFKNTSREALDLSPEELMERFVQGDASRKSDGSGLGLSIARSLTELQKGKLELTVDGDLFKVVLTFPALK